MNDLGSENGSSDRHKIEPVDDGAQNPEAPQLKKYETTEKQHEKSNNVKTDTSMGKAVRTSDFRSTLGTSKVSRRIESLDFDCDFSDHSENEDAIDTQKEKKSIIDESTQRQSDKNIAKNETSNALDDLIDSSQSQRDLEPTNHEFSPTNEAKIRSETSINPTSRVNNRIPEGLEALNFDFSDSEDEELDDEEEKMRKNEERRLSQSIKDILGSEYQVSNSPRQLPPLSAAGGQRKRSISISSSQEDPLSPRQKLILRPIGRDLKLFLVHNLDDDESS